MTHCTATATGTNKDTTSATFQLKCIPISKGTCYNALLFEKRVQQETMSHRAEMEGFHEWIWPGKTICAALVGRVSGKGLC